MNIKSVSSYVNYSSNARQTNFNGAKKLSNEATQVIVNTINSELNNIKSRAYEVTRSFHKQGEYWKIINSIEAIEKSVGELLQQ